MALQLPRSTGPQVAPSVAPTVRSVPTMDISNFGGGPGPHAAFGEARGLAQDVQRIALDAEGRAQEAQYNELVTRLGTEEVRLKNELRKVKGKDALAAADNTYSAWDKFVQETSKGATSARVRERLQEAAAIRRNAIQADAEPYAQRQMEEYEGTVVEERLKAEENAAIQAFSDPVRVGLALDEQQRTIRSYGQKTGKPPEWVNARVAEGGSRIHRGIISRQLQADPSAAARYFASVKDKMTAQDIAAVERPLALASLNHGALENAERIMNSGEVESVDLLTGKQSRKEVSLDEALEKSKEIEDLELRKQTQGELVRMDSLRKHAKQEAYQADVESALTSVEKGEKVSIETLARLGVTDRQKILSLQREMAKKSDRESDLDILNAVYESSPQERAKLQASDMLELKGKLSEEDYKKVKEQILSDKKDAAKPESATAKLSYDEKRLRLDDAGLRIPAQAGSKKTKAETVAEGAYKAARTSAMKEFADLVASKKLTLPEQQDAFDEIVKRKAAHLMQTFNVDDDWGAVVKQAYELERSDFENTDLQGNSDWEIPASVRKTIDRVSKSVPNWASLPSTERAARTNMAYVAIAQGQAEEFVSEVLNGSKAWPW